MVEQRKAQLQQERQRSNTPALLLQGHLVRSAQAARDALAAPGRQVLLQVLLGSGQRLLVEPGRRQEQQGEEQSQEEQEDEGEGQKDMPMGQEVAASPADAAAAGVGSPARAVSPVRVSIDDLVAMASDMARVCRGVATLPAGELGAWAMQRSVPGQVQQGCGSVMCRARGLPTSPSCLHLPLFTHR